MKILFVQKRLLFPTDAGMKIRTLNVVRYLARWHDLTYLSNVLDAERPYLDDMKALGLNLETIPRRETPRGTARFYGELLGNLASPYPYNVAKDFDPRLRRRLSELLAQGEYDVVICDFVQMARNVIGLTGAATVLFQHNIEAEIFWRLARSGSLARRVYLGHQYRKMRRFEAETGRWFDRVVAVSERDRQAFEQEYGWTNVRTIDTAVDTDYFQPVPKGEVAGSVVFVGSLDWIPNAEGIQWFVQRVWPRVRTMRPDATLQIVGRHPSPSLIRSLAAPGVTVVGTVPDVRPYLAEAQVAVVPLLSGGGTRLKIFEALAMRKGMVSTTLGAEGLSLVPDRHLLIADDEEAFATSVLRLLNDARTREDVGGAAFDFVTQNFAAESVARQFEAICREAVQSSERAAIPCAV